MPSSSDVEALRVIIIGAGPAGLTAASELARVGVRSVTLEKDDIVGGISRTVSYKGYLFDIGGHRFFTKVGAVERFWHDYLGPDLLRRDRISRIFYNGRFFHYPLRISNVLQGLGLRTSLAVALSYARVRLAPLEEERSFEDFVINRFGRRLYHIFFKTYTEKVWGMSCGEISAEWAAQRIKGLSLVSAVRNALIGERFRSKDAVIKTLIDSFEYPRLGPGMMWERVAEDVRERGNAVRLCAEVTKIKWGAEGVRAVDVVVDGRTESIEGTHFISTMPIRELVRKLDPPPPDETLEAASRLRYRDFLTVALIVDQADMFPDNWIYIHDDAVRVGRIQNFKNWSPEMVPDPSTTCLGLEYFCFEGDGLWSMTDDELIALGKSEMEKLGFLNAAEVKDGTVVRMPKAYPIYDEAYVDAVERSRGFLETSLGNLQLVGRNGMHRYNNQDHSMLTAMLAAENVLGASNDLWTVNVEQEYHEEISSERRSEMAALEATQPRVPRALERPPQTADRALYETFARMDKLSMATATGIVAAAYIVLMTVPLLLKGGENVGQNLQLLGQYFVGYTVSYRGVVVGALYGFFWGFVFGWLFAYLRNLLLGLYIRRALRRAEGELTGRLLDLI